MFSGFYLALVAILFGLFIRGVAFEFRSKDANPMWAPPWDYGRASSSEACWRECCGACLRQDHRRRAVNEDMQFVGNFFDLLSPYARDRRAAAVGIFALQGARSSSR